MTPGGMGTTQKGGWRDQGLGRATWPSGLVVAPPGQPQVPSGGLLPGNFKYNFFKFSGQLHCRDFFKVPKTANFHELEIKVRASEVLDKDTLVQQGE